MESKKQSLKERTKQFGIKVIKLVENFPKNYVANILVRQLLRSATSVGANYRAVCRARSKPDFISKMGIVEEEIDETLYWLELFIETNLMNKEEVQHLLDEANEITAMVVASINTAKKNQKRNRIKNRRNAEEVVL
ncbi:MAG: four helix bundle protein [bacterium]